MKQIILLISALLIHISLQCMHPDTSINIFDTLPSEIRQEILYSQDRAFQDTINFIGQKQPITFTQKNTFIEPIIINNKIITHAQDCFNPTTIQLWDLYTGNYLHTLVPSNEENKQSDEHHTQMTKPFAVSTYQNKIAIGFTNNTIQLWDVNSYELIKIVTGPLIYGKWNTSIPMDNNTIITTAENKIALWDIDSGTCTHTFPVADVDGNDISETSVKCIATNGSCIGIGFTKGQVALWDYNGNNIHSFDVFFSGVISIAMNTNRIAASSWDNTAKVWDLNTGTCLFTLKRINNDLIRGLAMDNERIIYSSAGKARILSAIDGHIVHNLTGEQNHHKSLVSHVSICGSMAVTGDCTGNTKIWALPNFTRHTRYKSTAWDYTTKQSITNQFYSTRI